MTLYEMYEVIRIRLGARKQLLPEQFNAIIRKVNLQKLNDETQMFEDGQEIIDKMSFLKDNSTLTIDVNGQSDIPEGYFRRARLYKGTVDVHVLTEDEYSYVKDSDLYPPSVTDPVCVFRDGYIQFDPTSLASAELVFLKYPAEPEFIYKQNATTGAVEYDSENSTEFEWPVSEHPDLIERIYSEIVNKIE